MSRGVSVLNKLIKNMQNRDADPLRPYIDEYLMQRDLSKNRYLEHTAPLVPRLRPGGRLSPSTIGGCERQAAFKFLGVEGKRKLDPDQELIFDDGNWRHHRWQATFFDMEAVLGPENFKVYSVEAAVTYPPLLIAGHSDALLKFDNKRVVLDIKGIRDSGFNYVYQQGKPKTEHVDQLTSYMKAHKVNDGILFYENKDNQSNRAFEVKFSPERWLKIKVWCVSVLRQLNRKELPPKHPDCEQGNFLYDRCPYAQLCYGGKSDNRIEKEVFVNFKGVKSSWKQGHQEILDSV